MQNHDEKQRRLIQLKAARGAKTYPIRPKRLYFQRGKKRAMGGK